MATSEEGDFFRTHFRLLQAQYGYVVQILEVVTVIFQLGTSCQNIKSRRGARQRSR